MTEDEFASRLAGLVHPGVAQALDESTVLGRVREYLAAMRAHLEREHRGGRSGRAVLREHTELLDRLVRQLFDLAESEFLSEGHDAAGRPALVAVGGYARREMSLGSDVDLLVLHRGTLVPYVSRVAERLQYWLWDAGLTVGCATRSVAETLDLADRDHSVATAILETRFLGGENELFHVLSEDVTRWLQDRHAAFVAECMKVLRERHERFGESLYLLQPNLKEGVGGLRDYHTALWVARAATVTCRALEDLLHLGLLTEPEVKAFRDALDFLWRVRNELHLRARRREDQLSFDRQEEIALALGYPPGDQDDVLPVERFMGDYYRHARVIAHHSRLVMDQCEARVRRATGEKGETPAVHEVEEGFRIVGGHLEIPHTAHLRQRPVRLLLAFAVAQDHDVPLSHQAQRMIRENLTLVDDTYREAPETAQALIRILESPRRVMRSLVVMNELGLLGRILPEWEHIVCRWQHVIYHTYTVDVHSIFLVEELRRLWRGKYEGAWPDLTAIVQEVDDRAVLFLGCLLHDVGKGRGGEHSLRGAKLARECASRLGLAQDRVDRIVFLVEHHLLMSHLAQRRDLSDPKLIFEFARMARDRKNLRNLYLLTFADVRASSPGAWTEWKRELLKELFERTAEFLEAGGDDPSLAVEQIEAQVADRQLEARYQLRALGVAEAKIDEFFAVMPRRYFVSHRPAQIARHALVMVGFRPERMVSVAVHESREDFSEVIVVTPDVHGLYSTIAGTLTARGINILGCHVYTTRTGLALESYQVSTPEGGDEERALIWEQFEETLRRVLRGEARVDELLKRRGRPVGAPPVLSRNPPRVLIDNTESHFYTLVDVQANDRLGLLYDLTRTLAAHDLEIYISKAATILDQVADTFYVKAPEGRKLTDPDRIDALRRDLLAVLREAGDGE